MTVIEITYSQLGRVVYKKQEITSHPINDLAIRYWLLGNLCWVLTFPWQGIPLDVKKHIDIHLLIAEKNRPPKNKYFFCRPTTSEVNCHIKMADGKMYLVQVSSQFSVGDFNYHKMFNSIEYQSMPKFDLKGPIRPHPFHN